jgi:flagellar L-ring protein precursor FlgH
VQKLAKQLTVVVLALMPELAVWTAPCMAQDSQIADVSMYADVKARKVGDLLQVIISESNSATNTAQTNATKQTSGQVAGEATTGALSGLFPGVGGSINSQNKATGQAATSRNGSITSRMSVRVVDMLPGGTLVIEGTKTLEVNEGYEVVTISGLVDPRYITSQNTVLSSQIANAKITYKGKGAVTQGSRLGLLGRLLNWIF